MMKRIAALLLTLAVALCAALPVFAAGTIEVTEDVSVSDAYDWTRFKGQNVTLNVYNWGEYISDGSEGSFDTVREFEKWYQETYGQKVTVNYSTFASNEDMYSKISSGAVSYDVIIPSDYMIARMANEGLLLPLNFDNI
ncbi:MAG: spermidine/putrescine ABC transporter substrate-binding protein, partial [Faecalibacterium sp.]|nr:spermidine/putrescine ABC transporter substrate-binding protein [Faecalibacterium sp.]